MTINIPAGNVIKSSSGCRHFSLIRLCMIERAPFKSASTARNPSQIERFSKDTSKFIRMSNTNV